MDQIQSLYNLISENFLLSSILGSAAAGIIGSGIFSFLRRPKPSQKKIGKYFSSSYLITAPTKRPAYSDRMAYVMAEMSDLAYYEFEGPGSAIQDAVGYIQKMNITSETEVKKFLESYTQDLFGNRAVDVGFLRGLLKMSGFELIDTINVGGTQGFACKCIGTVESPCDSPYVVVAFRGTEKKISDWLTDAKAIPTTVGKAKIHTGFYEAFTKEKDSKGMTTKVIVEKIINSPAAKDGNGQPLPIFFTGHSLGGALALLATSILTPDIRGACYTFGGPRIANYEFFKALKTPVYRIVNSSDIVPRVPPGAAIAVILGAVKLISGLTIMVPVVSSAFEKIEDFLDKLNGYRHVGDLRYLTDVAANKFDTVRLLSNPPAIDRIMWMWQHLAASLFFPVSAHSMSIYRKKLLFIASNRNTS